MAEEKKTLEEQQKAIDSIKNTVVAAGAGSGKTTVLSLRFLNLVQKYHYSVDEILTLTFTKKATVEMSDRIYKVLKEKAPEQAASFYKANIKTLDSYCNSVAKLGSRFYGISPDFMQDDEEIKKQVKNKALSFLLEHRENEAVKYFVRAQEYEKVAEELLVNPILSLSKIAQPINFRNDIQNQYFKIAEAWNKKINDFYELINEVENFLECFSGNKEGSFYNTNQKIMLENKLPEILLLNYDLVEKGQTNEIENLLIRLKKFTELKKAGNTKGGEGFSEIVENIKNVFEDLFSIANYVAGVPFTNKLIPLLEEFQEIVMNIKRQTKCLTFADISNMALCILRDYPEIRNLEKKKYKAIMIDEFQDNNQDQRDMLFLIAEKLERTEKGVPSIDELEKEKLFFVGDEKQSIYRFRGADVEVFNRLSKDFKDGNLPMYTNHRSHPELIAAFNTIFGGVKYPTEEAEQTEFYSTPPAVFYREDQKSNDIPEYEAIYHNVKIPEYKKDPVKGPRISLAFFDKDSVENEDDLNYEQAEVEWVARKIETLIAEGTNPSDIAVLLKNYTNQALFERIFLRHGIPYDTEKIKGFFSDGPISDMVAYLKLCVYEEDKMSYMQVLRSPFVNLSIKEAQAIISMDNNPFEEDASQVLEKQALLRFDFAKDFYKKVKQFTKENSIAKTVTMLWYDGGYRFETMWNHIVDMYGKLFDLMFELARKADEDNLNLSSFIDKIEAYKDEGKSLEISIPVEKSEGVHIMSVHKSKGLEFKIVFICNTNQSTQVYKNDEPVFNSKEFGITVNTPPLKLSDDKSLKQKRKNYFFEIAKEEYYSKQSAEMRRLTYVALTRAIDKLYITNGKYKKSKDSSIFLPGNGGKVDGIYDCLEPIIDFYNTQDDHKNYIYKSVSPFEEIEWIPPYPREDAYLGHGRKNDKKDRLNFVRELSKNNPYETSKIIKKEKEDSIYISPSKLHPIDDESGSKDQNGQIYYEGRKSDAPYQEINEIVRLHKGFEFTNFGTIAHAYMEAAVNSILEKEPYSNRDVVGLDGSEKDLNILKNICEKMRNLFIESDLGKEAINAKWKKAEYQFKSRFKRRIISGSIDLVYEKDDGTFVVIDYKTNETMDPSIYYVQLACYKNAICQMMQVDKEKVKCYLYYLRYNKEAEITDECDKVDLDSAIENIKIEDVKVENIQ